MSHQIRRWFNRQTIEPIVSGTQEAIRGVINKVKHEPSKKAEKNSLKSACLMTGVVLVICILIATITTLFAGGQSPSNYVTEILLLVGILAATFAITFFYVQMVDSLRDQRTRAFQDFASKRENLFSLKNQPSHGITFHFWIVKTNTNL